MHTCRSSVQCTGNAQNVKNNSLNCYTKKRVSHNSVTSHTQISDLFEGLILRSHPIGSKSKCNRVSQPPRRLWHSITLGLWPRCLRTSKFLSSVDLPRNCMHNVFSFRGSFQKCLYISVLVHAPTPWTQTRKPRTVTALATGRWMNDFRTTAITVNKRRKKEKEEVKKKRPLPLFDWQVYPKWNVQLLTVAPWPNDEPCFCPGLPTSAWFEGPTVFITVETASTMAVSHTWSYSSRGSSSSKERTGASMPAWLASVQRGPRTIRSWDCCEKHFHSLDRSAVIGLITALAAARLGLWSADHDLRPGYEPISIIRMLKGCCCFEC